ncbi:glycoside hydrolase family 16 protein [Pseudonocardia nigra]|uniref:glycoside hydrolase family 16 protein n=1 Tax=Pseudonocardia nigra TaxID=1921578 RepID=UPI001C5D4B50|nr:glycoside hydrolase family 16 protein [Pseudonocardia nigra]
MSRFSTRVRSSAVCAAIGLLLAGCAGAPGSSSAAPDPAPNLFEALPPPSSATAETTSAAPGPAAAPTTSQRSRPTATSAPRPREAAEPAPVPVAAAAPLEEPPPPVDPQWRPVGGDEFNAPALDTAAWNLYDSVGGFGTGYRKPEAISQSDGTLKITAKGDVSGGMGHEFGQLYGRWEFRARTDAGRGFGSAILLWPDSEQWPEDGELDIMEVPGENRDLAHFVVHWGAENHVHGTAVPGDYTQWHTFAVEWLPDRITWYVDGAKQYENTDKVAIPTTPMHLTIQLDQGPKANWIEARDETTPEEVRLEVDWVRIYAQQ